MLSTFVFTILAFCSVAFASCSPACKSFTIDLTWGPTPGNGIFTRNAILTNGSFPGPPLRLTEGDCVDFIVNNNMPNETGIHFHGIRQLDTPYSDGVPGVSSYGIQPGSSRNYNWKADAPGIYFYHSHYKGQMMDGLYGAIIISPAENTTRPFPQISQDQNAITQMEEAENNVETVLLSDWSRFTFNEYFEIEQSVNLDYACTDAFIMNGMGSQYCPDASFLAENSAPQLPAILNGSSLTAKGCIPADNHAIQGAVQQNLAALPAGAYDHCQPYSGTNYTYTVDPSSGWAAMSFISPSGAALFRVTIDGHKLYVYEINGNYVVPQIVDEIPVDNGDRISFLVKLDQTPADYTIRIANAGINQVISGFGVLSYKSATGPSTVPPSMSYGGFNSTPITPLDRLHAAPYPALSPEYAVARHSNKTFVLDIMKTPAQPIAWGWVLNGKESYDQTRDDTPPLLNMSPASIPDSDLILRTNLDDWVDLIVLISGPLAEPHPIHKHANKYFVIGAGTGAFNYSSVAEAQAAGIYFDLDSPPYVDGFTTIPAEGPGGAWMVLRYQVNTPGAWLLHCHVQTHLSGGMAVAILDAVDDFPTVPTDAGAVCGGSNGKGWAK